MAEMRSTRDAYGEALLRLGKDNPRIVALDADLSSSTRSGMFGKAYPNRFFNLGIAEQNMMGVAAGLALSGKIAFASSFAIFASGRAWEQVRFAIAYNNANVKIVASHAGISVGEDGPSHHCIEDIAIMRVIPNMRVLVPADAVEAGKMVEAMVAQEGPFYMRTSRIKTSVIHDDSYEFRVGRADVLREGSDISIIACGIMVEKALRAAEMLEKDGISAGVVNMSTIKPIDRKAIFKAAECGKVVTAEEHNKIGGLGSAVAEVLCEKGTQTRCVGVSDTFCHSGDSGDLLKEFGLTAENIVRAAKELEGKA